jgi:hypothetical protein
MNDYEQGQQDVIDRIKDGIKSIEKSSKGDDFMFDLIMLLKTLKVEPRN